jgi:hypothetical protein
VTTLGADELLHLIREVARTEAIPDVINTWGYVAAYDVDTHSIKAVLPTFRTTGPGGVLQPVVTDWIQLGTPWAGDGFGDQMAPYAASATPANPGAGEQVQIAIISGATGASYAPAMLFNQTYGPPGGIAPGERIIQSQGGKSVKFGIDQVIVNAGETPVAVEGSTVTHEHGLYSYNTVLAGLINDLSTLDPPITTVAELIPALVTIFTELAGTEPVPASITDVAGNMEEGAVTPAAVDVGQGAQDFFAPSPGGD